MAGRNSIQVLRGAESYDPSVREDILLDGQPFYSKKTKKLYIGDGVSPIKQLKGVQIDLNLENGEGVGSIISANLNDDDRPYTEEELPQVTGHEAFGFGKKIIASGKRSFAMGNTVEVTENTGFGFGQRLKVTAPRAVSFGYDSENSGPTGFTAGQGLKNRSQNCAIFGQFNEFDADEIAETRIFEVGTGADDNNRRSSLVVQRDGAVLCYGRGKGITPDSEYQIARMREIRELNIRGGEGQGSLQQITFEDDTRNPKATHLGAAALGCGTKTGRTSQLVAGRYNIGKANTLFEIGNGETYGRSNAFEVTQDGVARVYGPPQDDFDVVRKIDISNLEKLIDGLTDAQITALNNFAKSLTVEEV